jgi:hypothetical protein
MVDQSYTIKELADEIGDEEAIKILSEQMGMDPIYLEFILAQERGEIISDLQEVDDQGKVIG